MSVGQNPRAQHECCHEGSGEAGMGDGGERVADALNFSWVSIFCIKENAFLGSPQIFRL